MSDVPLPNLEAKYAWRTIPRQEPPKRSGAERMADFLEIYGLFDEATAREQASRCIQCPEPVCMSGCPLGSHIPEWLARTAEGQFLEAAAILHSTSNLSEVCVTTCPADRPCEGRCLLDGRAEPVSIWAIERFLNDYAFAHGAVEAGGVPPNGLCVAVVGSNPGGLACADELARRGYAVTIFDTELLPGGLRIHGLPAFKLEKSIAQRRIDLLRWRGVRFCMGVTFDRDLTLATLQAEFDAVFLGLGARKARPLTVPGADRLGVVQALAFIIEKNASTAPDMPAIEVAGRRVIVLGGGDTAMDCVRTAIRSGAREAICVYRRDAENMPCSRRDYANAVEEGARFVWQAAPVAVLGGEGAAVSGLRFIRTAPGTKLEDGRRAFPAVPGSDFEIPADWVFLALGFEREPLPRAGSFHQFATDESGSVPVDAHQMTRLPGVFAAGDLVRGPGTALEAVRDARKAAAGIHEYLAARWLGGTETAGS